MAEDWRVEVELGEEGHGLAIGDKLRSLDLDDEARERLGGQVIVTRDGSKMFLYAATLQAAEEARRVIAELIEADGLEAQVDLTHWDSGDHAWEDITASAEEHSAAQDEADYRRGVPFLVYLETHKPQILRDLGL